MPIVPAQPPFSEDLCGRATAALAREFERKTVCVIGYGNQGRSHALNLRDSGVDVVVSGRAGSASRERAKSEGLAQDDLAPAIDRARLVIVALPDQVHGDVWPEIESHLHTESVIGFLHGSSVHFGLVRPNNPTSIVLVAPKGPGTALRQRFVDGVGIPAQVGALDPSAHGSFEVALAWAAGIGCARAGLIESSFRDEAVADLFGEQSVICGGITALMESSYRLLIEKGIRPEVAYIECIQELKQIGDLVYERGIAGMRRAISDTAEAGINHAAPRIVSAQTESVLQELLNEIESGAFFQSFVSKSNDGSSASAAQQAQCESSSMEVVGARVRTMYEAKREHSS